jgi:hypothetical protein
MAYLKVLTQPEFTWKNRRDHGKTVVREIPFPAVMKSGTFPIRSWGAEMVRGAEHSWTERSQKWQRGDL